MAFESPIYDRVSADATTAKNNQNSATDYKGALNISDLNRIEHNTIYLHDTLLSYGYGCTITTHVDWIESDLFYLTDMDRIRQNCINLVNCYYDFTDSPTIVLGNYNLSITDINDVEKVLYDINVIFERMCDSFRNLGTFYSAQDISL